MVSDSQVYSVRTFYPLSLSVFHPIQKKPHKKIRFRFAIDLDHTNLHSLLAVCVGVCVPFSAFSFRLPRFRVRVLLVSEFLLVVSRF